MNRTTSAHCAAASSPDCSMTMAMPGRNSGRLGSPLQRCTDALPRRHPARRSRQRRAGCRLPAQMREGGVQCGDIIFGRTFRWAEHGAGAGGAGHGFGHVAGGGDGDVLESRVHRADIDGGQIGEGRPRVPAVGVLVQKTNAEGLQKSGTGVVGGAAAEPDDDALGPETAASMSSPVPVGVRRSTPVFFGFKQCQSVGSSVVLTTAVVPSASRPKWCLRQAGRGGSWTGTARIDPPVASTSARVVPSPPSAMGAQRTSASWSVPSTEPRPGAPMAVTCLFEGVRGA